MAKIKITEAQAQMLKKLEESKPRKVLKVTKEQYDRLFERIEESEKLTGHPIAGDGGSEYNPQTEKENEATHQSFNESVSEAVSTVVSETEFLENFKVFVKQVMENPSQQELSPFWTNLGITWPKLANMMTQLGLMKPTASGLVQFVPKKEFFTILKNGALTKLYSLCVKPKAQEETISLGDDMELAERDGDYPAGAEHDPNAPWNQSDNGGEHEEKRELIQPSVKHFQLVYFNHDEDGLAIFKHKDDLFVHLGGYHNGEELAPYCSDIYNPDAACVANYVNDYFNNGKFKAKTYGENYEHNMLTLIDSNIKKELLHYFSNPKLEALLGSVVEAELDETTTTGSVGGSYVTPKMWAKSKDDMRFGKDPMYKRGKIVEDDVQEKRFVLEMDMYIFAKDEKSALAEGGLIAKAINKKYDASARVTHIKEMPFGKIGESVERPGQVEFDDCTKLNNNKEAQEGGCSQGAVDGVVKVKESLRNDKQEALINEVARKTGRTTDQVRAIIANFKK